MLTDSSPGRRHDGDARGLSAAGAAELTRALLEDGERLFEALSAELEGRGVRAEIFLVGGATIAVAFDPRRSTRDLDAVFAPTDDVRRAVRAVAEDNGLTDDWLNDAVKGVLPGPDPDSTRFVETPHLVVDGGHRPAVSAPRLHVGR